MAYPRFLRSRAHKVFDPLVTSGQAGLTFTAAAGTPAWNDVTGSDVTLHNVEAGDVLVISATPFWIATTTSKGYLTFATMNGATRLTIYNNTAFGGVGAWFGPLENIDRSLFGQVKYTVQSGDIVGGAVTIRLMGAVDTGSRGVYTIPVSVQNLGPVDPN